MLHCRNGIGQVMSSGWFPPGMMLAIQAKEFNLCFSWPESPSGAFWQTTGGLSCLLLRSGLHLALYHTGLMVECCRDGCSSGKFSSLHREMLELCQSDHQVLGYQLRTISPDPSVTDL